MTQLNLRGVIPAHLSPFREDYTLDEEQLRQHIRSLAGIQGVNGIISNGHAGEVTALSEAEYVRVVEVAKEEAGRDFPIISGIVCDTARGAVQRGKLAKAAGAEALLIFPPNLFGSGGTLTADMPYRFFSDIAEGLDLPLIIFQFSVESHMAYTTQTLVKLVEEIPSVIAIKEGSNNLQRYEENLRALRACQRPVSILCTNNTKLLPSLAVGGDGIISGSGSVISQLLVQLWTAVEDNDLFRARQVYARMFPLMQVFYAPPLLDMHSRMKVALQLLGQQKYAVPRPPLLPIAPQERESIRRALAEAGLL